MLLAVAGAVVAVAVLVVQEMAIRQAMLLAPMGKQVTAEPRRGGGRPAAVA